jgi:uncharacterized protein (TIGR00369 family)
VNAAEPVDFVHQPDPDHPGWWTWNLSDPTRYNGHGLGHVLVRREGDRSVRVRLLPEHRHSNLLDAVHGGIVLGLADISLYAAARLVLGDHILGAVTLELGNQFMGAGRIGEPLEAVTEVLHETGRMVFLRGVTMQGERMIGSFSGTLRKASQR